MRTFRYPYVHILDNQVPMLLPFLRLNLLTDHFHQQSNVGSAQSQFHYIYFSRFMTYYHITLGCLKKGKVAVVGLSFFLSKKRKRVEN